MTSKRLEKEERRQAELVQSEEGLDATREKSAAEDGVNVVGNSVEKMTWKEPIREGNDLEDEEEEQAEDAMTGGA